MPARNLSGNGARLAGSDAARSIRGRQRCEVGGSGGPGRHRCRLAQHGDQDRSDEDYQPQGECQDRSRATVEGVRRRGVLTDSRRRSHPLSPATR
jgi:hypothetical protein